MTAIQEAPGVRPENTADLASLVVDGADQPGIVAAVAAVLSDHGANIVSLDQYSDNPEGGAFFQRTVFSVKNLAVRLPDIEESLQNRLGGELGLRFELRDLSVPKRMAIFASKSDHCLLDLLWRHRRGELPVSVAMVISNHPDAAPEVRSFGVPFFHVPSSGPDKSAAEAEHLRLLTGNVDFVVLARYMQILSDLDEGPIIEQDVVRVTHADTTADLQRRGADVERSVLSRAVKWHSEDRVILRQAHHRLRLSAGDSR